MSDSQAIVIISELWVVVVLLGFILAQLVQIRQKP